MNQVTESRSIEVIISSLVTVLDVAREIAASYEEKGYRLQYPDTGEKSEASNDKQRKDGYIPQLFELVEELEKVNVRNRNTLSHLNKIL